MTNFVKNSLTLYSNMPFGKHESISVFEVDQVYYRVQILCNQVVC